MALVVIAISAGVVVGYARGGRLRSLLRQRPQRGRLVLTALGIYLAGVLGSWLWQPMLAGSMALCLLTFAYFGWVNRTFHGAALVCFGLVANAVALLVHGAVPVSESAVRRAGSEFVLDDGHRAAADAVLPWLGKVIPVAFPPSPEVVSIGDVAIAAGLALFIATSMTAAADEHAGAGLVEPDIEPAASSVSEALGTMAGEPAHEPKLLDQKRGAGPTPESDHHTERSAAHG